jgi:CheY-like chemotaxis protein
VIQKLLLADDSVTIQRVIELTFADENVQVIAVGDGHEAIERIQSDRPDIVLADIGMPERDGYEVASFVKSTPEYAHIPVLLLTGAFEPVDEGRARSVGCEGVLVKPFEPQMVISRVRELLGKKSGPARPPDAQTADHPPQSAASPTPGSAEIGTRELPTFEPAPPVASAGDNLEDYFDRLDAALANVTLAPPPPLVEEPLLRRLSPLVRAAEDAHASEPVIQLNSGTTLIAASQNTSANVAAESGPSASQPAPSAVPSTAPGPVRASDLPPVLPAPAAVSAPAAALHEAFAALLAAEQRRPVAPAPGGRMSDEAIDQIVERVVTRMKDDEMRRLVLDTAERLVREEIDRIKSLR